MIHSHSDSNSDSDSDSKSEHRRRVDRLRKQAINMFSLKGLRKQHKPDPIKPNAEYAMLPGKQRIGTQLYNSLLVPRVIQYDKTIRSQYQRDKFFKMLAIDKFMGWIDRQNEYIDELSGRDASILRTYTYYGDVLVNGYCRHTLTDLYGLWDNVFKHIHDIPLAYSLYDQYDQYSKHLKLPPRATIVELDANSPDDIVINMDEIRHIIKDNIAFFRNPDKIGTLLEQYKTDIMRIIYSAPRLTSSLVVYRGLDNESHVTRSTFKTNDFLSTTVNPMSVLPFTKAFTHLPNMVGNYNSVTTINSGVYELTIHKNVPCLFISSISAILDEFEVLLPPGVNIKLDTKFHVKYVPMDSDRFITNYTDGIITVYGDVTFDSSTKAQRKTRTKARIPIDNRNSLKSLRKHSTRYISQRKQRQRQSQSQSHKQRHKTRRWTRRRTPISEKTNTFS